MVLHSREGASTAQRDIWPFVPPSGGRVTLGPDVGRLGNSNALDLSALCAHSGYGGRQRVAPAGEVRQVAGLLDERLAHRIDRIQREVGDRQFVGKVFAVG